MLSFRKNSAEEACIIENFFGGWSSRGPTRPSVSSIERPWLPLDTAAHVWDQRAAVCEDADVCRVIFHQPRLVNLAAENCFQHRMCVLVLRVLVAHLHRDLPTLVNTNANALVIHLEYALLTQTSCVSTRICAVPVCGPTVFLHGGAQAVY